MKWTDVKKEITSISPEDKNLIELMALLASIRKEKNMTQKELAEKVHVSQAQDSSFRKFLLCSITQDGYKDCGWFKSRDYVVDKNTKQPVRN